MRVTVTALLALGTVAGCAAVPREAVELRVLPTKYYVNGRSFVVATEAATVASQLRPSRVAIRACGDAPYNMIGDVIEALKALPVTGISVDSGYDTSYCASP